MGSVRRPHDEAPIGETPGRSASKLTDITLIVPVKDDATRLGRCLDELNGQSLGPSELIVVDGHSRDNTVEVARTFGATVLFEDQGTRSAACQIGIQASKTAFVAFTDADCIPDPKWLENLRRSFSERTIGVGGMVVNEGNEYWERAVNLAMDTLIGSANSVQGRSFGNQRSVSSISGCNSMYRRDDLVAVGGFDIRLPTAEDTEVNRRLLSRGDLIYVPDAVVHHHHQRGLKAFPRRMIQYGVGRGLTLIPGPQLLLPLLFPLWIVLTIFLPLLGFLLLIAYLALLVGSTFAAAARSGELRVAAGLPLVFLLEHLSYTVGFWKGLVLRHSLRRGTAYERGAQE